MLIQYTRGGNFFDAAFYNPLVDDFDIDILSASSTQIVAVNPGTGVVTTFTGTGFPSLPIPPLSGTLTGIAIDDAQGNSMATITGISWGLQATLTALEAAVGNDALTLLNGLLSLQDITLDASLAVEGISGLDFSGVTSRMTVIGSSFGDEILSGAGNDDLRGGGGNDSLNGGIGRDTLQGGDGNDTLDASTDQTGFGDFIRPGLGSNTILGSEALYLIREEPIVISYSDVSGVGGVTILVGANGSGTVTSGIAGRVNDTFTWGQFFQGSDDADTILVTGGGEWFQGFAGHAGNDTINGGTGYDNVDYLDERDQHYSTAQGVVVNMATGLATDTYGDTDTLLNIEAIRGTHLVDTVTARNAADAFFSFQGYAGADVLNGTALGFERADYSRDIVDGGILGIRADLAAGTVIDGFGDTDRVSNINAVRGTQFNDVMTAVGTSVAINFRGEGGNDSLHGSNGHDTLDGTNGNDTLTGGAGRDTILGGDGDDSIIVDRRFYDDIYGGEGGEAIGDTANFSASSGNFTVDLSAGTYTVGVVTYDLTGIETVVTGGGRDIVTGSDAAETILTGGRRDRINGGLGNDTIDAGDGDDLVFAGLGNDRTDGGAGVDTLDFGTLSNGISLTMADGLSNLIGTHLNYESVLCGSGNDTITGSDRRETIQGGSGHDVLSGERGADLLSGQGGSDTLNGGAGNDTLTGGIGADNFVFVRVSGAGADLVTDFGVGADRLQIDDALWNGTLTAAQVVSTFASVETGGVLFDFGARGSFTLADITSVTGLETRIDII